MAALRNPAGRARARYAISWRVNRLLYRAGFALLSDYFYQPLPSRQTLEARRRIVVPAVERTLTRQRDLVRDVLAETVGTFGQDVRAFGYLREGAQFGAGDAEFLYGMLRRQRPARVVEVGSGSSTAVIAAALDRNVREDGRPANLWTIDPFAAPMVSGHLHPDVRFERLAVPLQDAPPALWTDLDDGDVLFIDSSHVFKRGSDVELEFLHIYPSLRDGVVLHLHDVFFPSDYPLAWDLDRSQFWNEQHVLAAVLANSMRYEIIASLSAVHDLEPATFTTFIPDMDSAHVPGSIWLQINGDRSLA